ncbi:MAG: class D beta-lactamase [Coleofasciculaceae cyanobacterium]
MALLNLANFLKDEKMKLKNRLSAVGLFFLSICGILLIKTTLVSNAVTLNTNQTAILNNQFKNTTGAFVLSDFNNKQNIRYNGERCNKRFSPYSTFKIANSLIALETGVIKDENVMTSYDKVKHPAESWWPKIWTQDHNMRSAIKNSVVWYYQEIAKQVGKKNYNKYLKQFQYGNEDVSGPIDQFWLDSSLKISPNEEVEFLKRFYKDELPVSKRTTDIVKDILVLEKTDEYTLSGKTGLGSKKDSGTSLGWFVGYLEKKDNVYFFATNLEDKSREALIPKRVEITKLILTELGLIEPKT